jgi:hypothetical protein
MVNSVFAVAKVTKIRFVFLFSEVLYEESYYYGSPDDPHQKCHPQRISGDGRQYRY